MAKCIFIIEDDQDIALAVAQILEAYGYQTLIAANGRAALACLDGEGGIRPSLILLDLMMPVMDGFAFRDEQRRRAGLASIPVVAFTADGRAAEKAAALEAVGFVRKPPALDELLAAVLSACGPAE